MRNDVYTDFDEYVSNLSDADGVVMLQKVEQPVWTLTRLVLPGVHVQIGIPGSGNIMEGQGSARGYIVYLPLSSGCEYRANGETFGRGSVLVLEPGAEFCLSTRAAHAWCAVFVTTPITVDGDVSPRSVRSRRPTCRVVSTAPASANQLEALAREVTMAATSCDTFETSASAKRAAGVAASFARTLLGIPRAEEPLQQGRPRASRRAIIRSCLEWLEGRSEEPAAIGDLAAGAGVSERTLRTAFNECFGVSPTRYLELRRLHAVRHALIAADLDETTVTDVMVRHGVFAFGRFASQYRRLFNEQPSKTLAGERRSRLAIPSSCRAWPPSSTPPVSRTRTDRLETREPGAEHESRNVDHSRV